MGKINLYIPKKCKVGLQIRQGTYTGKLGYIIYHDGNVWRKETSWEGWRHKEGQMSYEGYYDEDGRWQRREETITGVEPIEFENVPTEGFVLNKKAGGYSSGWNHRQTYCRVYDPRGWEFEITIPNLLYILQECNAYKGKGLEGEFVYSWEGKDLVLLPVSSPDYKECQAFTNLQSKKIGKKDLVEGYTYLTSKMSKLIYLGMHKVSKDTYYAKTDIEAEDSGRVWNSKFENKHVFRIDGDYENYEFLTSLNKLKAKISDDVDPKFAFYIDQFQKSVYYSGPDHLEILPITKEHYKNVFERGWGVIIYKFGEIKTVADLRSLSRNIIKSNTETDKWDISIPTKVLRSYWSNKYELEGTFTREEIIEKYGLLYRVYKNGYKKMI